MIFAYNIYLKKIQTISWWILIYFCIIFFRLVQLQIVQHEKFAESGKKNFLRFKIIPAQRGAILDSHGIALATNQPVTKVMWKGTGNIHLSAEQQNIIDRINEILGYEAAVLARIKKTEKFSLETTIAENITQEQLCCIAEQCSDTQNVTFTTSFHRFYPYGNIASHLLGYLGDVAICAQGQMGLEKICEDTLRGDPGILVQSTNSFGSLLTSEEIKTGSCGADILTSIDLELQQMVETALQDQIEGCCILLDPKTGFIKALVSKPNFDPSIFSTKIEPEQWQALQEQKVFLNRAFNASYPPASVFKLVTIAAALEEKIISTNEHFFCCGYSVFKDRQYYCNKHTGHGRISTEECLAQSCNIPLFEIAKKIHIDTLAQYAFEFGLGNKTNIPFSEKTGLIPTNKWKLMTKGERWWTGETLSASIGQSFLLVTPIQVACMIGSIFTGYLVKPRITLTDYFEKKPINIHTNTRHFLQLCMKSASSSGSARRLRKVGNLTIYAKTGTAQTKTRRNTEGGPIFEYNTRTDKEHGWFVSYFYTDNTEPLVMVMLLEHVGRSTYTTAVAHKFFIQYNKWSQQQ
ncbi:hypothetical protein KBD08_02120 [Candidatus Babeliales bacterium]|nr:hypothetical protein [Candidatus Babeliales bacterium]